MKARIVKARVPDSHSRDASASVAASFTPVHGAEVSVRILREDTEERKIMVALDMTSEQARDLARRLCEFADSAEKMKTDHEKGE